MTKDEILKIQKRARYVATKWGYPQLADDFAQEVFISIARGWKQPIEQCFVDFIRDEFGSTRSLCGLERMLAKSREIRLDDTAGENEGSDSFHELVPDPRSLPNHESNDRGSEELHLADATLFSGREAVIYKEYYLDQASEKSISKGMGLTESRICQILGGMRKKIQDLLLLREGLQRMEWDAEYTKLQIDWIKI